MSSGKGQADRVALHRAIEIAFLDFDLRLNGEENLSTPYLSGPPGGGKTKSILNHANKYGFGFVARNMGLAKIEEFGGIPEINKVKLKSGVSELHTKWTVPELICELRLKAENYSAVVCLLDDWHLSTPQIQALGYELFTDYSVKGNKVPSNIVFLLAGNDTAQAGARTQFSAIMNRVAKMYVETDFSHWLEKFALPNEVHPAVASFLETPDHRQYFHGKEDVNDPWCSPRSWTNFSTKLKHVEAIKMNLDASEKMALCAAHVGFEGASKFHLYYNVYSKVNTKQIFNTGKFKIPTKPMEQFAFCAATASEFYNRYEEQKSSKKPDTKPLEIYGEIISALQKGKLPELCINSLRYVAARDHKILMDLTKRKILSMELLNNLKQTSTLLGGGD